MCTSFFIGMFIYASFDVLFVALLFMSQLPTI